MKPEESASTRQTEIMPMLPAMAVMSVRPFFVKRFLPLRPIAVPSDMPERRSLSSFSFLPEAGAGEDCVRISSIMRLYSALASEARTSASSSCAE